MGGGGGSEVSAWCDNKKGAVAVGGVGEEVGREGRVVGLRSDGNTGVVGVVPARGEVGGEEYESGELARRLVAQFLNLGFPQVGVTGVGEGGKEVSFEVDVPQAVVRRGGGGLEFEARGEGPGQVRMQATTTSRFGTPAVVEEIAAEGVGDEGFGVGYGLRKLSEAHRLEMSSSGEVRVASWMLEREGANLVSCNPMVSELPSEQVPPRLPQGFPCGGVHVDVATEKVADGGMRVVGRVTGWEQVKVMGQSVGEEGVECWRAEVNDFFAEWSPEKGLSMPGGSGGALFEYGGRKVSLAGDPWQQLVRLTMEGDTSQVEVVMGRGSLNGRMLAAMILGGSGW